MLQQFEQLKQSYKKQPCADLNTRLALLDKLKLLLLENENKIIHAIEQDFSYRGHFATQIAEIYPSVKAIKHCKKHLSSWMSPESRKVNLWFKPATASIMYQPLGVVGVIVPWNYPLFLSMGPLIAALSAGNRVMLKMSEFTPHFSQLFQDLCHQYLPSDWVQVINGEAEVGERFAALDFDHILFTGSSRVGKLVMQAASKNLTPVTLELGGKSPTIIEKDYPIKDAAEKIIFGKLLNAGQTCLAPDYVFVHHTKQNALIEELKKAARQLYPDWQNKDYTSLINDKQLVRHQTLIDDAQKQGAKVIPLLSGESRINRKVCPTVIQNTSPQMLIMQEEIFGPSLPILTYENIEQVIEFVNDRAKPLALYLFCYKKAITEQVLMNTLSGGVTLNDTILHISQETLPFGGVGDSGMGHYHGHEGFKTFSKAKSIFKQSRFAPTKIMYPPYGSLATRLYKLMRGK